MVFYCGNSLFSLSKEFAAVIVFTGDIYPETEIFNVFFWHQQSTYTFGESHTSVLLLKVILSS